MDILGNGVATTEHKPKPPQGGLTGDGLPALMRQANGKPKEGGKDEQ